MPFFSFKRVTSSGNFIPEIDGLRFIAITSIVIFHIDGFLSAKTGNLYTTAFGYSFLRNVFIRGHVGVPLFFVISGFILGMPFAKFHLKNGESVILKEYFFRRLTRLEPPYILVMTVLFLATVFFVKKISLNEGLQSYFSSIFYIHNFVYGKQIRPLLNAVAWSLEIEVQFYILAPLLAYLFSIRSLSVRRILIGGIAVFFVILNYLIDLPIVSLINYIQYFLIGFLLTDLYISNSLILPKTKLDSVISFICFVAIWFFDGQSLLSRFQNFVYELMQLTCIFLLYYYILMHKVFKILSARLITNIGGMCYSIYLIHTQIISMFGNIIVKHSFSKYSFVNVSIYEFVLLLAVLIISSSLFLFIERPCMDKTWYRKMFKRQKAINYIKNTFNNA